MPDAFVAGEETALLAALAGRAAKPTVKPPYPFERGLEGAPTLVQNAETLAHLALIARFGADWFRGLGTEDEPGTALVTLSGRVARPGVYEIELGTPLSHVLEQAGGPAEPAGAFLVGGYFGGWTADQHLPLTRANGLGAGVIAVLPAGACGVHESARVARYLAGESAGQCGPCVQAWTRSPPAWSVSRPGRRDERKRLERWASRSPDAARAVTPTGPLASSPARSRSSGRGRPAPAARPVQRHRPPHPRDRGACMSRVLRIDPIACEGHGLCAELFPERVTLDDWGFPIIDDSPVPAGLERHARRAVRECPKLALRLEQQRARARTAR